MAYWYLAQPDELLLDLDDYMRPAPSKSGESRGPWGEIFFRRRLADAIRAERLDVVSVYLDRSNSERHWHAMIRLARPMPLIERLVWQLRLGSDLMRGQADLMRAVRGTASPSLLIRRTKMADFYREPDRECVCTRKHDTAEQSRLNGHGCPVWRELRGMTPWELFGPCHHGDHRGVALPVGEVPMELILAIDERRQDMKEGFEDVVSKVAQVRHVCTECGQPIAVGDRIYTAFWTHGGLPVTFHEHCWEQQPEKEEPR